MRFTTPRSAFSGTRVLLPFSPSLFDYWTRMVKPNRQLTERPKYLLEDIDVERVHGPRLEAIPKRKIRMENSIGAPESGT